MSWQPPCQGWTKGPKAKWLDIGQVRFMDWDKVKVHNNTKGELDQCSTILTELVLSINDLLYGIKNTEKMIIVLVYFWALKREPVTCKSDGVFRFSQENLHAPTWTSAKCYWNKMGCPLLELAIIIIKMNSFINYDSLPLIWKTLLQ